MLLLVLDHVVVKNVPDNAIVVGNPDTYYWI